jgi:hypothetical protein
VTVVRDDTQIAIDVGVDRVRFARTPDGWRIESVTR